MTCVPNSDSEQCTRSRLGWVHQVHTLTQAARTSHAHCAQAGRVEALSWACARLYRGLWPAVSWPRPGECRCSPCSEPPCTVSWRAAALYRGPLPPSLACHNTVCCIVTQLKKKLGSSPFHIFLHFFSHSSYWKTTKKIFIFFFSKNQINLLKFIFFFLFYTL